MLTAGVDAGAEYLKVVLFADGVIQSYAVIPYLESSVLSAARQALDEALNKARGRQGDVKCMVATGVEREAVSLADETVSAPFCCAAGVDYLLPSARTVLDLGADKSLAVRCEGGRVLATAVNDGCAAGTGRFLKIVCNLLGVGTEKVGQLSLQSAKGVEIENTCAVFAESEIISLIHQKHAPEDIARGAFTGLARRIYPLLTKAGLAREVALIGGLAKNIGIVKAIEGELGFAVIVPEEPLIVGALGAAIIGAHRKGRA